MDLRLIFDSRNQEDVYRAHYHLKRLGFDVEKRDNLVMLIDADDETATSAGNFLLDLGFSNGICW